MAVGGISVPSKTERRLKWLGCLHFAFGIIILLHQGFCEFFPSLTLPYFHCTVTYEKRLTVTIFFCSCDCLGCVPERLHVWGWTPTWIVAGISYRSTRRCIRLPVTISKSFFTPLRSRVFPDGPRRWCFLHGFQVPLYHSRSRGFGLWWLSTTTLAQVLRAGRHASL